MQGAGSSFDFAITIPNSSKRGVEYLEEKINGIAKAIGTANRKGKKFVKDFLEKADKSVRKKNGFFDKNHSDRLEKTSESTDKLRGRMYLFTKVTDNLNIGFSLMNMHLMAVVATVYLAVEAFQELGEVSDELVMSARRGILAFGSLQNGINAYKKFQGDIIGGRLRGEASDLMLAAQELNMIGVKATDAIMKSANDLATVTGESTNDVVSRINSFAQGDLAAFDDVFGKNALRKKYAALEGNERALTDAIVRELTNSKKIADAARNMPMTFEELGQQISAGKDSFLQAVFGSTADPNSFAGQVMRSFDSMIKYFRSKAESLRKIAGFIGAIFMTLWQSISRLVDTIIRPVFDKLFAFVDKTLANYKDTVTGLVLYIQLITTDVIIFLQKYGKMILWAYGLLKLWGAAKSVFEIGKDAVISVHRYFRLMRIGLWRTQKLFAPILNSLRMVNLTMLANPIGLIIAAVILLITYVVLLVKYWEEIRVSMQNVNDTAIFLLSAMMPLVGIPMLLAKHWEKFKVIFHNIWASIYNEVMSFWFMMRYYSNQFTSWFSTMWTSVSNAVSNAIQPIINGFKSLFKNIYDIMPDWVKDFGSYLYDSLVSVGSKLASWFNNMWAMIKPDWLSDVLNVIAGNSEKLADSSKKDSEFWAKKVGETNFTGIASKSADNIDERKSANEALALKNSEGSKSPLLFTPNSSKVVSRPSSTPMGDTINNNVVINVPEGSSRADIERIVESALAKRTRRATLRNN